ncbi:type II secretion system F family protein [Sphingomonas sp. BN140010]|uniref:Type II secretion system F family protein n=1 Tax=Sphingomonas arvum TaxID=2992113 RepID=A0ABT3JDJ9_9SPHN|nr:type II secretion system F family protein [Sphingomonas sp. BN140010]MCW3797151.1 type II secretion system F family protein [Sphingomonas sp. BN140010]
MLMLLMLAGAAGATLLLLALAFNGPSPSKAVKRRLELLKERHADSPLKASAQAQIRKLMAQRQGRMENAFSSLMPRPALLRLRLERTGKAWTLGQYGMVSAGILMIVFLLLTLKGAPILLALMLGLFVATGLPHMTINYLIKKRLAAFNVNFPDAIELMVRGLRSGLPITETLGIVSGEIGGPVGVEFRAVSDKMKIGRTMDAALQETADRLGTPEFQFFVITLAIQRETGGNLAETLSNLADVLRKRAQMKLKIKAMSSESKASAMIVGSLPFIVFALVSMMNPKYMGGFFTDPRLMVAGIGGLIWMGIGVFIMAKMINFEI